MDGYTLRFPFRLAPGQEISNLEEPYVTEQSGFEMKIGKQSGLYFLSIDKLPSEQAGKSLIPKLWAGLMWALLHQGLSPDASLSPQEVKYADDPRKAAENISKSFDLKLERLDSLLDGSLPAIYQTDKVVRVMTGFPSTLSLGFSPEKTIDLIVEALALAAPERVLDDQKLKVALDLYNAYFRESSANARFLTLTMALEALAPVELKHDCAQIAVEKWIEELRGLQAPYAEVSEEWEAFDSLIREVGFRREKSIRSRIRSLVYSSLESSEPNADETSRQAVRLYDKRSELLHNGHVREENFGRCISDLRDITFRVLKAHFLRASTAI